MDTMGIRKTEVMAWLWDSHSIASRDQWGLWVLGFKLEGTVRLS